MEAVFEEKQQQSHEPMNSKRVDELLGEAEISPDATIDVNDDKSVVAENIDTINNRKDVGAAAKCATDVSVPFEKRRSDAEIIAQPTSASTPSDEANLQKSEEVIICTTEFAVESGKNHQLSSPGDSEPAALAPTVAETIESDLVAFDEEVVNLESSQKSNKETTDTDNEAVEDFEKQLLNSSKSEQNGSTSQTGSTSQNDDTVDDEDEDIEEMDDEEEEEEEDQEQEEEVVEEDDDDDEEEEEKDAAEDATEIIDSSSDNEEVRTVVLTPDKFTKVPIKLGSTDDEDDDDEDEDGGRLSTDEYSSDANGIDDDDDDLMNSVVSQKTVEAIPSSKVANTNNTSNRRRDGVLRGKIVKRRNFRVDFRLQMKKKSLKWLNKTRQNQTNSSLETRHKEKVPEEKQLSDQIKKNEEDKKPLTSIVEIIDDDTPEEVVLISSNLSQKLESDARKNQIQSEKRNGDINLDNNQSSIITEAEVLVKEGHPTSCSTKPNFSEKEMSAEKMDQDVTELLTIETKPTIIPVRKEVEKEKPSPSADEDQKEASSSKNEETDATTQIKSNDTASATKRPRQTSESGDLKPETNPAKKLCIELEETFKSNDKKLNDYINKSCAEYSEPEIETHMNQVKTEISTLNDMIREQELEWNNMIHLKKMKEEVLLRLTRKKQVLHMKNSKVGEAFADSEVSIDLINETLVANPSRNLKKPERRELDTSSNPLNLVTASSANNATAINRSTIVNHLAATASNLSTTQSILHHRVNMKASDLIKEKSAVQKVHRYLVSRNILPKPSSMSSGATGTALPLATSVPVTSVPCSPNTTLTPSIFSSIAQHLNLPTNLTGSSNNISHGTQYGSMQPILNQYLNAAAATNVHHQLGDMFNGQHGGALQKNEPNTSTPVMVGRQGVIKDVKSIIADYRQKHPEAVPRRGRRLKSGTFGNLTTAEANTILGNALKGDGKINQAELNEFLAKFEVNRTTSSDSQNSMTNPSSSNNNNNNNGLVSFQDVLVQFAKMSGQTTDRINISNTGKNSSSYNQSLKAAYPEVTLHPVSTSTNPTSSEQTGSLLHGILTKYSRPNASSTPTTSTNVQQPPFAQQFTSSFSPTLAKLLTAPERLAASSQNNTLQEMSGQPTSLGADGTNDVTAGYGFSRIGASQNSEITITPVVAAQVKQHTLQQLNRHLHAQALKESASAAVVTRERLPKSDRFHNMDDEADDSVDRLVIDETVDASGGMDGNHWMAPNAMSQEINENEVPICQGCKKHEAQFVCAGCGNQWYCSRECQVSAWDDHSEVCTG